MKKIAKAGSMLTMISISEMAIRFIRTKCIAVFLGTAGTGFLAQLTILFETLRVWGDLGSRRALIKQIAECREEGPRSARYREVLTTSCLMVLTISGAVALGVTFFSARISSAIYGDPQYANYVTVVALFLPVASLMTVAASAIKGNLKPALYAKYTIAAHFCVALSTPLAVFVLGKWGAILAQFLFFAFPLISYLVFNFRHPFLFFARRINGSALKEQFSFGFINLYSHSLMMISRLVLATWVTRLLGLESMGIYQVVLTFTMVYMAVPIQLVSGYTLPVIAAAQQPKEIDAAVNDTVRYLLFLLSPIIVSLMTWPEIFISFVYSSKFLAAAPVLRIQLIGTFITLLTVAFHSALIAKAKLKAIFVIFTLEPIVLLSTAWFLFESKGLEGIALAMIPSAIMTCVICGVLNWHYFRVRLQFRNLRLLVVTIVWAAAGFGAGSFSASVLVRILVIGAGVPWFFVSLVPAERSYLFGRVKNFFSKKGDG